jgi:hypothetical protein
MESPGTTCVPFERARGGDVREREAFGGQGRIGPPEAGIAAKVGKTGVHAHASPDGDEQSVGLGNEGGGPFDGGVVASQPLRFGPG